MLVFCGTNLIVFPTTTPPYPRFGCASALASEAPVWNSSGEQGEVTSRLPRTDEFRTTGYFEAGAQAGESSPRPPVPPPWRVRREQAGRRRRRRQFSPLGGSFAMTLCA